MSANELRVESIQIGSKAPSTVASVGATGIDKRSVEVAEVTRAGLVGDVIANVEHHGGPDQAVYVYTRPDYDFWESELQGPLCAGLFGENVTLSGLSSVDVSVGDRFTFGAATIEATSTRIPCNIFQHHLDEPNWVERFRDGRRPGFYCRVIGEGEIRPGDVVRHQRAAGTISILETQDLYYDVGASADRLRLALESPVAERARALYEARLSRR